MKTYRRKHYNPSLQKIHLDKFLQVIIFLINQLILIFADKKTQKFILYTFSALLFFYMLLWNWPIVIATTLGVGIMTMVYFLQSYAIPWQIFQQLIQGPNKKLIIASTSGGFAALTTYISTLIWTSSKNPWLAAGTIMQGLGTITLISLVSWLIFSRKDNVHNNKSDDYIEDLTNSDPLKRLIAVHYLAKHSHTQYPLKQYYRLMLARENNPTIKSALLEKLANFEKPLIIPINILEKIPN